MGKRRRRGTGKKRADKGFSVSSKCSEYGRYPGNVQGSTCWIYGRQPFQDALSCYEGHHEKIDGTPSGLESDLRSACDLLRRQDTGITFSSWQSNSTMLICSRDRLLSQSVSSYALLLHYFMFTQNSGLTHAFILIAAGLLLTMGVLRLLRYLRSRSRSRRGAWS